jgi:hypothetical protein
VFDEHYLILIFPRHIGMASIKKNILWYIYIISEDHHVWGYSGQSMKLPTELHLVHTCGTRARFVSTPLHVSLFAWAVRIIFTFVFNSIRTPSTGRCRGFTNSFPSLTVSSYWSHSVPQFARNQLKFVLIFRREKLLQSMNLKRIQLHAMFCNYLHLFCYKM